MQKAELPTLYAEHEIACHGVTHRHPRQMNQTEWLREVWQDRLTLEELTGQQNSKPPAQRTMPPSTMQNTPSRISARMRG